MMRTHLCVNTGLSERVCLTVTVVSWVNISFVFHSVLCSFMLVY